MELKKSCTILHFREQNCSLATRSHTQFYYVYEIPNTCLLSPDHLEMRSRKSWELVIPSSQQSSNVALVFFKNFQRYKEKLLSLSANKFISFSFLLELRIACQVILNVPGSIAFPIVLTTRKTLIAIKTIVKTRDPGNEIENEVSTLLCLFQGEEGGWGWRGGQIANFGKKALKFI